MKTYINLLPMSYRRGQLIRRRLKQWCVLWLLAALATVLLGWTQWSQYQASATKLESLRIRYEPIDAMKGDVARLQEIIDSLQRREALALSLADERSMLGLVGLLSQARQACDGRISIANLSLQRNEGSDSTNSVLTFSGVAEDDQAVAQFAGELRAANAFLSVDLKSTANQTVADIEARTYTMECTF